MKMGDGIVAVPFQSYYSQSMRRFVVTEMTVS